MVKNFGELISEQAPLPS